MLIPGINPELWTPRIENKCRRHGEHSKAPAEKQEWNRYRNEKTDEDHDVLFENRSAIHPTRSQLTMLKDNTSDTIFPDVVWP